MQGRMVVPQGSLEVRASQIEVHTYVRCVDLQRFKAHTPNAVFEERKNARKMPAVCFIVNKKRTKTARFVS